MNFRAWRWSGAMALGLAAWLAGPARAGTNVNGAATALRATVLGARTALADTGPLASSNDSRFSSLPDGTIAGLGGAKALHAATISSIQSGGPLDEVSSSASLGNPSITVAGQRISASFLMAWAAATVGGASEAGATVEGLSLNGVPIAATGAVNQRLDLPGLTLIVNEQRPSAGGVTVNALHITTWDGLVDVVMASATAGVPS